MASGGIQLQGKEPPEGKIPMWLLVMATLVSGFTWIGIALEVYSMTFLSIVTRKEEFDLRVTRI